MKRRRRKRGVEQHSRRSSAAVEDANRVAAAAQSLAMAGGQSMRKRRRRCWFARVDGRRGRRRMTTNTRDQKIARHRDFKPSRFARSCYTVRAVPTGIRYRLTGRNADPAISTLIRAYDQWFKDSFGEDNETYSEKQPRRASVLSEGRSLYSHDDEWHLAYKQGKYGGTLIEPDIGVLLSAISIMTAHEVWRTFDVTTTAADAQPIEPVQPQPVAREYQQTALSVASGGGTYYLPPQQRSPAILLSSGPCRTRRSSYEKIPENWLSPNETFQLWKTFEMIGLSDANYDMILGRRRPCVPDVHRFLTVLHASTLFSAECLLIAVIYVARVLNNPYSLTLTCVNWRPLLFTALLIAHKYWDDEYLTNQDFRNGYCGYTCKDVNTLEVSLLRLLRYRTGIGTAAYAHSYFVCRIITEPFYKQIVRRPCRQLEPLFQAAGNVLKSILEVNASRPQNGVSARFETAHDRLRRRDSPGPPADAGATGAAVWTCAFLGQLTEFVARCTMYTCRSCRAYREKECPADVVLTHFNVKHESRAETRRRSCSGCCSRRSEPSGMTDAKGITSSRLAASRHSSSAEKRVFRRPSRQSYSVDRYIVTGTPQVKKRKLKSESLFSLAVFPQCSRCGIPLRSVAPSGDPYPPRRPTDSDSWTSVPAENDFSGDTRRDPNPLMPGGDFSSLQRCMSLDLDNCVTPAASTVRVVSLGDMSFYLWHPVSRRPSDGERQRGDLSNVTTLNQKTQHGSEEVVKQALFDKCQANVTENRPTHLQASCKAVAITSNKTDAR